MKLKFIIYLILSSFMALNAYSADTKIADSLKRVLSEYDKKGREDTAVTNILLKLYLIYEFDNPSLSLDYMYKSLDIFRKAGRESDVASCFNYIGRIYFQQEMYYLAMENYYKGYEIFQKQKPSDALAYSLNDIGNTYFAQKIYDIPLEYYRKSAEIFKGINDKFGLSVSFNNIGLVMRNTGKPDSALYYFNLSLGIRNKLNSPFLIAHSYYYIAKVCRLKRDFSGALDFHNKSLGILNKLNKLDINARTLEADIYLELGSTFSEMKEFSDAKNSYLRSIVIYSSLKRNPMLSKAYIEVAQFFVDNKKFRDAADYAHKGLAIAQKYKFHDDRKKAYSILYLISIRNNKKDAALNYLRLYSDICDSVANLELANKLNEVRTAIKTYSKEKEIEYLRSKTRDIKRLSFAIILFLCSIILFAIYYLNSRRKNEKRWRQLSNVTFEGVLIHDNDKILDCNNKFLQLTGYSRKEISRISVLDIILSKDRDNALYRMQNEHISDYECEILKKDGTTFFAEILARGTNFRGKEARVAAIRDISLKKHIEMQLNLNNEELKEINATKDKFFNIIASDLRSPFLSIIGLCDQLLLDLKNNDSSTTNEYVSLINESAKKSYFLLENLFDWALSQTGKINFAPAGIMINPIISEEIELMQSPARKKEINLLFNPQQSLTAFADEKLFRAVIRNLISNAIKFTNHGGEVNITLAENQNEIEVCVSDTGIGISDEQLPSLFLINISLSASGTYDEKGTGLGLLLCKEFVEKNGGKIRVESKPGFGSRFFFTLPKAKAI